MNESTDTEHESCHNEIKMNGVDESDVIESGSCRVKVNANNDGKASVIDSGSGHIVVQKKNVNKSADDGKVGVRLCKKTYVLTSAVPTQDEGHAEVTEDSNLSAHNCVNGEAVQVDNLVPFSERMMSEERERPHRSERTTPELVELRGKRVDKTPSPTADVRSSHAIQFLVSADSKSACTNSRVLPANCDAESTSDDHVNIQLALSLSSPETELSLSPLSDDVFARTKNGENAVNGEIIVVDKYRKGGETDPEWKPVNGRLILSDLPTVHREGSEAIRYQMTNCRMISRPISDTMPTVHSKGGETDPQQQLSTVHGESSETDRREPTNSQSPTVCSDADYRQLFTNDRLNSDNLLNARNVSIEMDGNTNCQLRIADIQGVEVDQQLEHASRRSPTVLKEGGSETDRRRETSCVLQQVECRGGETEQCRRPADYQLPSVHKHQMLVDCDINTPHSVWTTVVNQNSLMCNGRESQSRSSHSTNEV